jgi:hypothetical protein
MSCFDLHRKYPAACPHAVGLNASSTGTRLLSLSTIADAKISNPPWVNFQSAGWVSFQSAPTNNDAFVYDADKNVYICPDKEELTWRNAYVDKGKTLNSYWTSN